MSRPIRLCIIVTASVSLYGLYRKQWRYWIEQGFDVHGIAGFGPEHKAVREMGVTTHPIAMERSPSILKDIVSLCRLWWFLLWNRFDIVHVSTPKASFLGALAARLSGHRRLIYTLRGRAYENMTGWRRSVMSTCEWLVCRLAARVIPICNELGQTVVKEGLCAAEKIRVIGSGSSNGVDLDRFTRTEENIHTGENIRKQFGVSENHLVILFVGWLRREKGINELVFAFDSLAKQCPQVHLFLLGDYEPADPLEKEVISLIEKHSRIHRIPWRQEPAPVYAAADIFAFPSYREGFGNVVLEASAMELPVVASDIMGCREAVRNGETGLLVPPGSIEAIVCALKRLVESPTLRNGLGREGRKRVGLQFRQEFIWGEIHKQYREILFKCRDCLHSH